MGNGVQLSEKCSIKRSVIGNHCSVKDKTKIINSVIMDHVNIGDKCVQSYTVVVVITCYSSCIVCSCTIQGCIISSNVIIGDKVNLKDCTVGNSFHINNDGKLLTASLTVLYFMIIS